MTGNYNSCGKNKDDGFHKKKVGFVLEKQELTVFRKTNVGFI